MSTALASPVRPKRLASSSARLALVLLRARTVLVLALLLILFSVLAPSFLTANNLSILSKHVAISAILAIGMTFVILAGGIDLSVGSVVGLGGMVAGFLLTQGIPVGGVAYFPPLWMVLLLTAVACLAVGLLNGWLVTKAGVAPFIATLGTLYMSRGAALLLSDGKTFPNLAGSGQHSHPGLIAVGQGSLLWLPFPVWIMIVLYALATFVAVKTPWGRHVYAIGGNERAARLCGINVSRVKIGTYLFSSLCAFVVGIVIASQLEAAHPATGETFELNAIAAVVLGGTALAGGRGSITGSLLGAFVIGVLTDGLVMLGVSEFWQIVIKGIVIVLAVSIDQLQTRAQARLLPLIKRHSFPAGT